MANGNSAHGGAIDNSGNLTIKSSVLMSNDAIGNATTAGAGGAIYNETRANLTIINSELTGNQAIDGVVSGGTASGGAVEDAFLSTTSIRGSTLSFNQAISSQGPSGIAIGGAIDSADAARVTITKSQFSGNMASGFSLGQSGAINNDRGALMIRSSVFTNNRAIATGLGGSACFGRGGHIRFRSGGRGRHDDRDQLVHSQSGDRFCRRRRRGHDGSAPSAVRRQLQGRTFL